MVPASVVASLMPCAVAGRLSFGRQGKTRNPRSASFNAAPTSDPIDDISLEGNVVVQVRVFCTVPGASAAIALAAPANHLEMRPRLGAEFRFHRRAGEL